MCIMHLSSTSIRKKALLTKLPKQRMDSMQANGADYVFALFLKNKDQIYLDKLCRIKATANKVPQIWDTGYEKDISRVAKGYI